VHVILSSPSTREKVKKSQKLQKVDRLRWKHCRQEIESELNQNGINKCQPDWGFPSDSFWHHNYWWNWTSVSPGRGKEGAAPPLALVNKQKNVVFARKYTIFPPIPVTLWQTLGSRWFWRSQHNVQCM